MKTHLGSSGTKRVRRLVNTAEYVEASERRRQSSRTGMISEVLPEEHGEDSASRRGLVQKWGGSAASTPF